MPKSDHLSKKNTSHTSSPISGRRQRRDATPQDADQEAKLEEAKKELDSDYRCVQEWHGRYRGWYLEKEKNERKIEARLHDINSKAIQKQLEDTLQALQVLEPISDGDEDDSIKTLLDNAERLKGASIRDGTDLGRVEAYAKRMKEIKYELYNSHPLGA